MNIEGDKGWLMHQNFDTFEKRRALSINWFNKSSDLHGAAATLWTARDRSVSSRVIELCGLDPAFDFKIATAPAYRMTCGLSLELMYKAICVERNVEFAMSHDLLQLARSAGIPENDRGRAILQILTEAVVWEGRYPVPRTPKGNRLGKLAKLRDENLFDRESLGRLSVSRPNGALDWMNFDRLWQEAGGLYWRHHRKTRDMG